MNEVFYYESHVTIRPVEGVMLDKFLDIAREQRFHVATFTDDTAGPNSMICTGRGKTQCELTTRMFLVVKALQREGFAVTRYKLESTILDSRIDDSDIPLHASLHT